jgi:hypothetical protein
MSYYHEKSISRFFLICGTALDSIWRPISIEEYCKLSLFDVSMYRPGWLCPRMKPMKSIVWCLLVIFHMHVPVMSMWNLSAAVHALAGCCWECGVQLSQSWVWLFEGKVLSFIKYLLASSLGQVVPPSGLARSCLRMNVLSIVLFSCDVLLIRMHFLFWIYSLKLHT